MAWAVAILASRRGEILLQLRDNKPDIDWPNLWGLVGGVIEADETPTGCVVREVREETGEMIEHFESFQTYDVARPNDGLVKCHVFSAALNKSASELLLGEGQELRFFAPGELASIDVIPEARQIISDFMASAEYGRRI